MVKRIMLSVGMVLFSVVTVVMQGQGLCQGTGNPVPPLPKQPKEVEEQVKRAYALFEQGQYEAALSVALKVHQQHGNVMVCWYPRWVLQYAKGNLPDPYDKGSILRATVEGSGLPIPANMAVRAKSVRVLIAQIYEEIGDYKEAIKWYERVGPKLGEKTVGPGIHVSHMGIIRCMQKLNQGYRPPQPPPKNTWRPLPLKFREEDYFILVPLDEACKVLGLSFRYKVNPKTGKRTGAQIGEKGLISLMGRPFARNIKGEIDDMAYAPYEEGGVVWVPFYWLAKQAGIRWWEVRDGKIYVAPK
jgi:hypothetical protein